MVGFKFGGSVLVASTFGASNLRVSQWRTGQKRVLYACDGSQVIEEQEETSASSGVYTAERQFVYGSGIDRPLMLLELDTSDRYYYVCDRRQNVMALVDDTGALFERYDYDAYGTHKVYDATASTSGLGSAVGNPFRFAGRRYDPGYGLWYFRNRMYSSAFGRFLQRDPAGFVDGYNLYAYVTNNPLSFIDPLGLARFSFQNILANSGPAFTGSLQTPQFQESFHRFNKNTFLGSMANEALAFVDMMTSDSIAGSLYRGNLQSDFNGLMSSYSEITSWSELQEGRLAAANQQGDALGRSTVHMMNMGYDYETAITDQSGLKQTLRRGLVMDQANELLHGTALHTGRELSRDEMNKRALEVGATPPLLATGGAEFIHIARQGVMIDIINLSLRTGKARMPNQGQMFGMWANTPAKMATAGSQPGLLGMELTTSPVSGIFANNSAIVSAHRSTSWLPSKPNYTQIPNPKNVNASSKPTPRQVREMKKLNMEHNNGILRDDVTGELMVPSSKSMKNVTPPANEVQVDHIIPVNRGGTRTMSNLVVPARFDATN